MDQGHVDAPAVMRRRRKAARQQREKTPEPTSRSTARRPSAEDESSSAEQANVQSIKMQIKPAGTISAHKSKILSRRNKNFTGAVARSLSSPRQEDEVNSTPEVFDLLRSARRSLSSPRHKEESSESGRSSPHHPRPQAPLPPPRTQFPPGMTKPSEDDRLSRLERNLQRFEEERRKFDLDKKKFEREKRDLHNKIRYKQIEDDRKRLMETYRKVSDRITLPTNDPEERGRKPEIVRETKRPASELVRAPIEIPITPPVYPDYESSTISSSDSDAVEADVDDEEVVVEKPVIPERKKSLSRRSSSHSSHSPVKRMLSAPAAEIAKEPEEVERPEEKEKEEPPPPAQPLVSILKEKKEVKDKKEIDEKSEAESKVAEKEEEKVKVEKKPGIISRMFSSFKRKPQEKKIEEKKQITEVAAEQKPSLDSSKKQFLKQMISEFRFEWRRLKADYPQEIVKIRLHWNKCLSQVVLLALFCGFGGMMFRFMEGSFENIYKCGLRKIKRNFIDQLWTTSHNMREEDWKSAARNKLRTFEEELQAAYEAGVLTYSGKNAWNFVNSVLYCLTVITTIGYGHITPKTTIGRGVTIIYAIIGIPIFLILLADFGKLFTRCIKFLWAYVRRVYYTGTCRKIRHQKQVRQTMKNFNTMYDITIRRPSAFIRDGESMKSPTQSAAAPDRDHKEPGTPHSVSTQAYTISNAETPTTPYPETMVIDDEFNLPVSLATTILLGYIFFGAFIYHFWEKWSYFESFYFVFISMSTIGFGDFVPDHPIFMMCSIIYLIFGLALTSMCINVVQEKLKDSFAHASAKLGATIGLKMAEEESRKSQNQTPSADLASVHSVSKLESILLNPIPGSHAAGGDVVVNNNNPSISNHNNAAGIAVEDNSPPPPPPRSHPPNDGSKEEEKKSKRRFFNF